MATYEQEPPFAIQIELVEGCNLRCTFCGLNGIRGKSNDFKFMEEATLDRLCRRIAKVQWNSRIEFAMHGEPSVHPQLADMLRLVRKRLPKHSLMMTSNGAGFLRDVGLIDEALESLNVLALDWYENVNIVPKVLERYAERESVHPITYYPEDQTGNPHRRRKPNERLLVVIQDIATATTGVHSHINNHAGAGAPKNDNEQGSRCAKPFRELSVRWDGSIAICCNDWRGEYACGNTNETPVDVIWNGEAFAAARRYLYHGMRTFGPCEGCDAKSYRLGLLPDKYGKQELPTPSPSDAKLVKAIAARPPLTRPVLRPWEL